MNPSVNSFISLADGACRGIIYTWGDFFNVYDLRDIRDLVNCRPVRQGLLNLLAVTFTSKDKPILDCTAEYEQIKSVAKWLASDQSKNALLAVWLMKLVETPSLILTTHQFKFEYTNQLMAVPSLPICDSCTSTKKLTGIEHVCEMDATNTPCGCEICARRHTVAFAIRNWYNIFPVCRFRSQDFRSCPACNQGDHHLCIGPPECDCGSYKLSQHHGLFQI